MQGSLSVLVSELCKKKKVTVIQTERNIVDYVPSCIAKVIFSSWEKHQHRHFWR